MVIMDKTMVVESKYVIKYLESIDIVKGEIPF